MYDLLIGFDWQGSVGGAMLLTAYATRNKLIDMKLELMNLVGSWLLVWSALIHQAVSLASLNTIWAACALVRLIHMYIKINR